MEYFLPEHGQLRSETFATEIKSRIPVFDFVSSPVKDTVVVNDRWGMATHGKHGGFMTHKDKYNPSK